MVVIPREVVTVSGHAVIVEASTVGLKPGEWPDFLTVETGQGEGILFGPCWHPIPDGGGRVYYSRGARCSLHLLND